MDPKLVSSIRDEVRVALAPLIRTPQIGLMSGATFATLIENAILASHEAWALGADTPADCASALATDEGSLDGVDGPINTGVNETDEPDA